MSGHVIWTLLFAVPPCAHVCMCVCVCLASVCLCACVCSPSCIHPSYIHPPPIPSHTHTHTLSLSLSLKHMAAKSAWLLHTHPPSLLCVAVFLLFSFFVSVASLLIILFRIVVFAYSFRFTFLHHLGGKLKKFKVVSLHIFN
jgi:hypothetical protein